jgi:magnesium chelatase family protein
VIEADKLGHVWLEIQLPNFPARSIEGSARGYHRVLHVARTLADLDGTEKVGRLHLAEALSCRALAEDIRRAA